jgi:hypothetical protein
MQMIVFLNQTATSFFSIYLQQFVHRYLVIIVSHCCTSSFFVC